MGRPEADSTDHQPQEYDLQPQEYQYEPTTTQSDIEINHFDYSSQPPQQPPFSQQQQQSQQYPPAQPPHPAQFPSGQTGLNNPAYPPQGPQKPAQYPPHNLNQPAAYPPQPVQFPPPSPQANPTYQSGLNQPAAYTTQRSPPPIPGHPIPTNYPPHVTPQPFPQGGQQGFSTQNAYQAPQPQAVSFPPQNNNNNNNGYNMASSPYKPAVQPPMQGIPVMTQQVYNEGWNTGLFDCMDDPPNAIITACFPCITFGQVAEIIDNGQTTCATSGLLYGVIAFFIGFPCIMSCSYRTKLRAKYGLVETPAPDWITHCFCEWCALCQEYRELRTRGLDPAIGWQGNLMNQSMQNPQVATMPPMNQKMMP